MAEDLLIKSSKDYAVWRASGSSFTSDFKLRPTVSFEVRAKQDDTVAWRSRAYWASAGARSIGALQATASKSMAWFQYFLDSHGYRHEVAERERKEAEAAVKKKATRLAWLRKNVPTLLAELQELEAGQ